MQFDSDYKVRLTTLQAMGGDVTKKYDSVYEIDLAILDIVEHGGGGGGAVIDDNNTSTGTTWSSSKIVSELADAGFDVEIVTELPSTGDAHTIYFMASQDPQTSNVYDEFMYINENWEQVGSTAIDLSNYATLDDISTFITENDASVYATKDDISTFITAEDLNGYATESYVNASLANYPTKSDVNSSLADYATLDDISTFVTSNDVSVYATKSDVDASLAGKQDTLTAGANISIVNNVISATGGGGGSSIDDNNVSTLTTYSSYKIESEMEDRPEYVELTQSEYDQLSTAEKNNGSIYSITDATIITPMSKAQADTYYNPINSVTANSYDTIFPTWNSNGQITGQAAQAYQIGANINGTSKTLYATGSGDMPTVYAPTSAGTAGQYLVSSGSGAPTWQALEVASDYVISDADASAGTYSSDIAAFYTKTISENVVQGVQIKFTDEHVVDNASVYSDSYYLPSSSRIYEGNVELWLMTTENGVTWENRHYLITNNSITLDVSTGTFGS